jgi:hypothetical protein
MSSIGSKGSQQTNKKTEKGFKDREQSQPKCALVWRTGLSGVPAEQRLLRANDRLQKALNALQCAPESEQSQMAHRTVNSACPVHHRTVRCPRRQKLQRSESNGYVTWHAHWTVSGGAPDCPVRHATTAFTKRLVWWLGL